jgi:hypothetical protein
MNEHETLARLLDLANKLQKRITEAEEIRARLADAREDADHWPDVHHTSRPDGDIPDGDIPDGDIPELPYFRRPDDDSQAH